MDRSASARQYVPRPHPQPEILDSRYHSIPPPPPPPPSFTARPASAQPTVVHSGDPFLQRRVNTEEQQHNMAPSRTYGQPHRANYVTESLAAQHERARREEYSSLLRDRHERPAQYMTRPPDSMSHLLYLPEFYIGFIRFGFYAPQTPSYQSQYTFSSHIILSCKAFVTSVPICTPVSLMQSSISLCAVFIIRDCLFRGSLSWVVCAVDMILEFPNGMTSRWATCLPDISMRVLRIS